MNAQTLNTLNNEELLQKLKSLKNSKIIDAVLIGFTLGVAVYSAVTNGFGFPTFFPLVITYALVKNSKNNKILEAEIKKELSLRDIK